MAQESGFDFFGFGDRLAGEGEVREKFWRTAKKAARQIPFMDEVVAAYYCAMDKETPLRAKGILLAAFGYFVLPVDFAWSDLGAWDAVWQVLHKDDAGNASLGDVVIEGCRDTLVHAEAVAGH